MGVYVSIWRYDRIDNEAGEMSLTRVLEARQGPGAAALVEALAEHCDHELEPAVICDMDHDQLMATADDLEAVDAFAAKALRTAAGAVGEGGWAQVSYSC